MFWTEPELPRIRVAKDGMSIKFIFKVRIPKDARKEPFKRYWKCHLRPPADRFERALQEGYERTVSGKKPVHRHISNFLRRACVKAFEVSLENSWGVNQNEPSESDQLKVFKQQAGIRSGPQPKSVDAVKVARLYEKYSKLVKQIRNRLKRNVPLTMDRALEIVSETDLPPETILMALRAISDNPAADLVQLTASIGTAELAQAITEQKLPRVDFKKVSFRKYRALGKRLLSEKLWETNVLILSNKNPD